MKYFTQEFILFFGELEENNTKEWFHANKKRYEAHVKKPMVTLVTDAVQALQELDHDIVIDPKKCIGRINRDIRFSADKTPYKIHSFAHISKGEKADPLPAIAFQMGAKDFGIMSGFYNPPKERLKDIRANILRDPAKFRELYSHPDFADKYGTIKGEAIKRIPSEYKECFDTEPLITNKQFYYVREFTSDILLTDELLPTIIDYWQAARPMNAFLSE
ncbi:MAG: DUF2461 domain-containing protein [Bacteroidota bacterium]